MPDVSVMKLFLEPRSIALVGVSRKTGDGTNVLENLLQYGYLGKLYPVNPNASEILGVKTYASVRDIPDKVDLAVVYTARALVPQMVRQCAEKGIKAVAVIAQGFADADEEGKILHRQMLQAAREGGVRIVGPNSFGVANAFLNLNTAFVRFELEKIPIAAIAQTGMLFAGGARLRFLGKAVDLGNACDIGFEEVLEYFGTDPDIKVIALYLEGILGGRKFLEIARQVTAVKPVIALKGGRTPLGAKTVLSHTGSLAGRDEVYAAAFRQSGIFLAESFPELEDLVTTFWRLPLPKGRRLGIITVAMAGGVIATDACARYGLQLASISPETKHRIAQYFPSWLSIGNPVDTGMSAFTAAGVSGVFREAVVALLEDPGVDALLLLTPTSYFHPEIYNFLPVVSEASRLHPDKPIVSWLNVPDERVMAEVKQKGMVNYSSIEVAVKSLRCLADYAEFRQEVEGVAS